MNAFTIRKTPTRRAALPAALALALGLGLALLPASGQPPEDQPTQPVARTLQPGLTAQPSVTAQPVQPGIVNPQILDTQRLEVMRKARDSASAPDQKQRDPQAERAQGEAMPAVRVIREADRRPALELDPALRRTFELRLQEPDMAAELTAWERQGQPAVRGDLPAFEEVKQLDPRRRPEPPRANADAAARELAADARQAAEVRRGKTHLKLVLRLKKDGATEVVSATELPGGVPVSEALSSDFVYELALGGEPLSVESLTGDPFEYHSFGNPVDTEKGHYLGRADEATIVVEAPDVPSDGALDRLSFSLFKLEKGPAPAKIDATVLQQLQREQRLAPVTRITGQELAPKIRELGILKRNDG